MLIEQITSLITSLVDVLRNYVSVAILEKDYYLACDYKPNFYNYDSNFTVSNSFERLLSTSVRSGRVELLHVKQNVFLSPNLEALKLSPAAQGEGSSVWKPVHSLHIDGASLVAQHQRRPNAPTVTCRLCRKHTAAVTQSVTWIK